MLRAHVPDQPVASPADEPQPSQHEDACHPRQPARAGEASLADDARRVQQDEKDTAVRAVAMERAHKLAEPGTGAKFLQ